MSLRQETDLLPRAPVTGATVFVVCAIAIGATVAWLLQSCRHAELGQRPITGSAQLHPPIEVNAIEMSLFDPRPTPLPSAGTDPALDRFGWIDREAGVVHIPVDRAIDLYLARQKEAP